MASRILVVGSANMDLITRVARHPRPGETILGQSFSTAPGGKGANQAVAAGRLGCPTWFLGCVGDDAFGSELKSSLASASVDLAWLKTMSDEPSGNAVIVVDDQGQNSIIVTPCANGRLSPSDIESSTRVFRQADVLVIQLEIPLETVGASLRLARRHGLLSILDAGPAMKLPEEILRAADIVSPNETEAEANTGIAISTLEDARQSVSRLHEMGVQEVVLKLGRSGALYSGVEEIHSPAFEVKPVDTTAAGDAFTAGLAATWREFPHAQSLRFANACGGLAATRHGAQPSMPSRREVEDLLAR